jgi:hypothetical protein
MTCEEEAELHWLEAELLRRVEADFVCKQARAVAGANYENVALGAAAEGNLRPLRRMYPRIAEYINPPTGPRGRHRPRPKQHDGDADYRFRVRAAYEDAKRIRALWREREGRVVRKQSGQSANWFAAKLWDLGGENEVEAGRPSGRKSRAS